MATVEYGTSGKDVLAMQKFLNAQFGKTGFKIPEDGTYGDEMAMAVNDLAGKIGFNADVKAIDSKFLGACKEALKPRTRVVVNGVEAWVTKEQLATLQQEAGKRAGDAVRRYVSMSEEVQSLWDAHAKTRQANQFWATFVEVSVGTKFPPVTLINAAVAEAKALERDARACKVSDKDLSSRTAKIREAYAAMDQYREELFVGGEQLAKNLETIADGCVMVLQVSAAVATGGASWQVQVGVSAGLAAYEATLKEVTKASKAGNYSVEQGVASVFMAAVVDGTVGLILKGGGGADMLKQIEKDAIKKAGGKWLAKFIAKSVNGGAQQMIEDGIKGLPGLADPSKKITVADIAAAGADSFIKGAALGNLGDICEAWGTKASKKLSAKQIESFFPSGTDVDKQMAEGLKKSIDQACPKIVQYIIDNWDPTKSPSALEAEILRTILDDNTVKREAADLAKKAKKK